MRAFVRTAHKVFSFFFLKLFYLSFLSCTLAGVAGLMNDLGLQAIYPKPNTSRPDKSHEKYPYLLKDYPIVRPGQVYSMDITYVRLDGGFAYLCAVIDWHSRYVLSWRLSNTLDTDFCLEALEESLRRGGPETFNTDQGCQFTSKEFTGVLKRAGVLISMDGRGRALDNIFVERLWRSIKYENIYPMNYRTMQQARTGLERYFKFYNGERFRQSLAYRTPEFVHFQKGEKKGSPDSFKMEANLNENLVFLS
jgi:putative transposase